MIRLTSTFSQWCEAVSSAAAADSAIAIGTSTTTADYYVAAAAGAAAELAANARSSRAARKITMRFRHKN